MTVIGSEPDKESPAGLLMPTADDLRGIADFGLTVKAAAANIAAFLSALPDDFWDSLLPAGDDERA